MNDESLPVSIAINAQIKTDIYAANTVTTTSIGPQFTFLDGTLSLSAIWLHGMSDSGARSDGILARLDAQLSDQVRGFAGYGYAPEIDGSAVIETQSLFAGLSYDVNDTLTLRASAAKEFRDAFDRSTFGFGLTKRF